MRENTFKNNLRKKLIEQIIDLESRGLGALVSVHVLQKPGIFMTKQKSPEANLQY